MPRYRMLIEYDGTDYHGWQKQPNGKTIQADIEAALKIAARQEVSITGAGRTDAGVHARGQVAHFDLEDSVDTERLTASVNALTPRAIAIRKLDHCSDTFHSRFDANQRRYGYHISTQPVALHWHFRTPIHPSTDFAIMNEAANLLVGKRNYSSFCLTQSETKNRVCEINEAGWHRGLHDWEWEFRILADRFLHGMVRAIVGTLLEIGRNHRSVSDLARTIDSEDRREAGPAAPPAGLVLEEVYYPNNV